MATLQVMGSDGIVRPENIYCTTMVHYVGQAKSTSFSIGYAGVGISGANSGAPSEPGIPSGQIELADFTQFQECAAFLTANQSPVENAAYLARKFKDAEAANAKARASLGPPTPGYPGAAPATTFPPAAAAPPIPGTGAAPTTGAPAVRSPNH